MDYMKHFVENHIFQIKKIENEWKMMGTNNGLRHSINTSSYI